MKPHIKYREVHGYDWPRLVREFEIRVPSRERPLFVITDGWKVVQWAIKGYERTGDQAYGGLHLGYK